MMMMVCLLSYTSSFRGGSVQRATHCWKQHIIPIDGWMDGWMDGWADDWIHRPSHYRKKSDGESWQSMEFRRSLVLFHNRNSSHSISSGSSDTGNGSNHSVVVQPILNHCKIEQP